MVRAVFCPSRWSFAPALSLLLLTAGCSRGPAEPDPPPTSASSTPLVPPLTWQAPGTWTATGGAKSGSRKASYQIEPVGNEKEPAVVDVFFYGTGAKGDPEKIFSEWFGQFDGNVGATAKREQFDAGGMKVETVEVEGTYKIGLGPAIGPKKKSPMQVVKENFRLYGAVVKTADRGNWFFKMAGPNETLQATKPAFRQMLEEAK